MSRDPDGFPLDPDPLHPDAPVSWTRGDWMQTFTGRQFYPLDPHPDEIDSADIAHALSLLCRYGGHVDRFYSVAEHCVLMSQAVAPEHALAALLHDATEAYVVDVPRPLKRQLAGYRDIEARVWNAICLRFHLAGDLPVEVKEADDRILLTERDALMSRTVHRWSVDGLVPLPVAITGWSPHDAEVRYLDRLAELLPEPPSLDREHLELHPDDWFTDPDPRVPTTWDHQRPSGARRNWGCLVAILGCLAFWAVVVVVAWWAL